MNPSTRKYNDAQANDEKTICDQLATIIDQELPEAENKIWHSHPVWFLNENPIVGYSKLKAGIRLMFWSGAGFQEEKLISGSGKFKDASIMYKSVNEIKKAELTRWLEKGRHIQWDYKNIYKRKGKLVRL